jgi:RES domain-containing protein
MVMCTGEPPPDLAARRLPLTRVSGPLYRVHRANLSPLFFGKSGRSRFDDPRKLFGVLYPALKPEAAFAEAFLRQLDKMLISEHVLAECALSVIRASSISCVNLTARGVRRLSCDNRIADELPYRTPGLWSRALFEHPQKPAGMLYRSRHNPELICVALFSTVEKRMTVRTTTGLLEPALRAWTVKQLNRYRVALLPTP